MLTEVWLFPDIIGIFCAAQILLTNSTCKGIKSNVGAVAVQKSMLGLNQCKHF